MKKLLVLVAVGALMASTAGATLVTINDIWNEADPGDPYPMIGGNPNYVPANNQEWNLYEIVNYSYGTNFTSSSGATAGSMGAWTGGMDAFRVSFEFFNAIDDNATFVAEAKYAGYPFERMGLYSPGDSTDPNDWLVMQEFLRVQGMGFIGNDATVTYTNPITDVELPAGTAEVQVSSGFNPFGLYLESGDSASPFYSAPSLNPNGRQHLVILDLVAMGVASDEGTYLLAWEDRATGDWDFNDLVVEVRGVSGGIIPEPATMTLLGLGLAGMLFRRFRRS